MVCFLKYSAKYLVLSMGIYNFALSVLQSTDEKTTLFHDGFIAVFGWHAAWYAPLFLYPQKPTAGDMR